VVTLTLALGIGVNTALFTMFHLFDRRLPLKKPGSIVMIEYHEKDDASHFRVSFPEYLHLRNHTTALSDLAAGQSQLVVLAGQGDADGPLQVPKTLLLSVYVRPARYDATRTQQYYRELTERMEVLPGVQSVTRAGAVPGNERDYPIRLEGETAPGGSRRALINEVGPNYFNCWPPWGFTA
jgi:hypothetical protein